MPAIEHNIDDLPLAAASNVESLRAQRVFQIVAVGWFTWLFFTMFCLLRGYWIGAGICFAEVVVLRMVLDWNRGNDNYRRVMNCGLGVCGIGILLVSVSHPALHRTILFYPVSILIASQLLGIRDAFQWLLVNICANTVHVVVVAFGQEPLVHQWDELTLICGVGVCVFFCCQQGEQFYHERTNGLLDLSKKLKSEAKKLELLATTDSLTGLLNRFQFQRELRDHIRQRSRPLALMMVDMDGFKEINDTLGHPIGDLALMEVACRLTEEFGDLATISRLGGDEFCLLIPDVADRDVINDLGKRVCAVITQHYILDHCDFPLGASVGSALAPYDTESETELLSYADTAMFVAKENRTGYAPYEKEMTDRLVEYRTMQDKLSCALEKEEFFLVYQPQVCLQTGLVTGVEVLMRWRNGGEVIPPVRFIPLLEKSREIVPVGRWIIRESCRQLSEWNRQGLDFAVSINLSSVQFEDEHLLGYVSDSIEEFGIDPTKLDFEITETLLIDNVAQAAHRLSQLKEIGASISIDDFGTGYSSLAYLRQFPIDRLKIDRAFVKDIPDNDDGVIAESIVALSKALGLKVLAEGVETPSQLELLKSLDCDEYQGYFFSRPVSHDEIAGLVLSASGDREVVTK